MKRPKKATSSITKRRTAKIKAIGNRNTSKTVASECSSQAKAIDWLRIMTQARGREFIVSFVSGIGERM